MLPIADLQINNFVKGLITEASPLTFPQGASLDELNFKLKSDGTRERRLGIDLEDGYGLYDLGISADVLSQSRITAYRWSIPNGDITSDIGVIQVGNSIYFINLYAAAPSAAVINGGVPIVSPDIGSQQIMTFTSLNNYLIGVSNALDNPYLFTYDRTTQTVTAETSSIMVRDLWGVQDEVDVNQRPTILTPEHHYNLLNQGWDNNIKTTCGDGVNAIDCTFNTFGVYPANGDQWSQGRIEDLTSADVMKYDPGIASRMWINTGQVAKGHFIIPIYNRGSYRTNATGLTLPTDREIGRITTVASYAGRVFYGGVLSRVIGADNRSPSYNGTIFFSQIFTDKINLVKCYQEADPTNPDLNDIVDTDGGIIQIPECSYIYLLKSIKQSLFVFAANGVWEIRGDEGGFRATSFQVNKISNIGVYAPKSVVEVNGTILFWGNTGIYAISPNQFGTWDTQDLTQSTIQRLYNAIPDASKRNVRGMYDNKNNRARWMYYSPDNKVLGQPVENIAIPATAYTSIAAFVTVDATASEPKIARLSATKAIVIYRKGSSANQTLYYRILTIDSDLAITSGVEQIVEAFGVTITGYDIIGLQDNKALIAHRTNADTYVRVINYSSGETATIETSVAINNVFLPVLQTSQLKFAKVSSTRVVLASKNTDNNKPTCQIIDINSSDVITFGAVAKAATTSVANPNITILDSTKGVMSWTGASNVAMEVFTISGTSIAFNGTTYPFPNASQFPTASSRGIVNMDIKTITTSKIFAIGEGTTVISGVTTYAPILFIVEESGGILTSTTALQDSTHNNSTTPSSTIYGTAITDNNKLLTIFATSDVDPETVYLTQYTGTTTPVQSKDITLDTGVVANTHTHPDIVYLGNSIYISVIWSNVSGSTLKAYGIRYV